MSSSPLRLSDRAGALKPSSTLAVTARVKALQAAGVDVIGFGAGEPDFDTPAHIKQAAIEALERGRTKYEPNPGTPEARAAVARYMNSRHGFDCKPENVIISVGGKHSLYLAFMALVNPGDEVLIPAPYWVTYPEQARLAGGVVKEIPTTVDSGLRSPQSSSRRPSPPEAVCWCSTLRATPRAPCTAPMIFRVWLMW